MDAADQLDQAVSLALQGSDAGLKSQAVEFVTLVQSDPAAWLAPSLDIVASSSKSDQTQFFALQVIEWVINSTVDIQTLNHIRSRLWARSASSFGAPKHIRNKLANALAALFCRLYPEEWSSFFVDLLELLPQNPQEAGEMYVNVLLAIHERIGDQLFTREPEEQLRANWLKDAIRDRDAIRIAQSWVQLLNGTATASNDPPAAGAPSTSDSVIDGVLRVIGGWAMWTDLSLVMHSVPLIEKQLGNPATRSTAVQTLSDVLSKKMSPDVKLELLKATNIVGALKSMGHSNSPEFDELVARLVNSVLLEAAHAIMEFQAADASPPAQELQALISDLFPLVIQFLGDEYDDTSVQLVPGVTEYMSFLRREARRNDKKVSIGGNLNEERTQHLRLLLDTLVAKSRYDPDDYELGDVDDEEEGDAPFDEFRAKVRVLQEQLSHIDTRLFLDVVGNYVSQALAASTLQNGPSDWTALELALYELSVYNDVARLWVNKALKCGNELIGLANEVQQTQFMLFGQMVVAGSTGLSSWGHPANRLWYMELVHRQAPQFLVDKSDENRKLLTDALDFFMKHGVQSPELKVRLRSWYLFYRLLKAVRRSPIIASSSLGPTVFSAVAQYLSVHVSSANTEDLVMAAQQDTIFTSQLFLYELCGILFAAGEDRAASADLMRQLLATMFADIDAATTTASPTPLEYLRVHHNVVALSALTKGVSETASDVGARNGMGDELTSQLKTATQMVVAVLERLHAVQIIRDACRQAFSRMLAFLGESIIMEISGFINVLLQTSTPADLGDFLAFLGQLSHQFETNEQIFEMFSSLSVPLFEKIFSTLQEVAQAADVDAEGSTDAQLFRRDVVATYMQLVYNMLNNRYGAMLFSEDNSAVLDNVYTSLLHFSRNGDVRGGAGSAANQKMAVVVLTRMIFLWGRNGKVEAPNFGANMAVPLFASAATYEQLTELCWTLPADQGVSFADAQTRMVVSELAGLQQVMWEVRGPEYQNHVLQYLNNAGLDAAAIEEFALKLNAPPKDFKRFFVQFLQKALAK